MIAYGDPNLQDLITGVENVDGVAAFINIETPTGTLTFKKSSEDGVVAGIKFTTTGTNFEKIVTTGNDGSISIDGMFPGVYTVTEASYDRYVPQSTQRVTIVSGQISTFIFSNTLKRDELKVVKNSENNLAEGVKFHLYGISFSGLPVDEYAIQIKMV